jgi:hypothetical protein
MSITNLAAAPLSDGRLQVWACKDENLFTIWKSDVPSDSGWSDWTKQRSSIVGAFAAAAASLPNGAVQLFVINNQGPAIETTFKLGSQSGAGWADWTLFINPDDVQQGFVAGAQSVAAIPLSDGRMQVFGVMANQNVVKLVTRWKLTTDVSAEWNPKVEMPFVPGEAISRISAGRLSDGRVQLFATTVGSKVFTSWKVTTESSSGWQPWEVFYSGSEDDQITAANLSDGRMQLWRLSRLGELFTRWKATGDSSAAWTEWQPFSTPTATATAFTAGPLSDGRLQLFLADASGEIFTSWKVTTDPDAEWAQWESFGIPS